MTPTSSPIVPAAARQPVLVLGMHRSGTSALARVLQFMGAWPGDDAELLPAHPVDNPTGYCERVDIVVEHDRFLEEIGFAWDRVAGFDPGAIDPAARQFFVAQIAAIMSRIDTGGRPWLLKDPRLCLLLPLWRELLERPAYVVVVRDPSEIAASMYRTHRGGYPTSFLLALWEKYMRLLLDALEGERVLFVSYPRLLADAPAESARLAAGLGTLGIASLHPPADDDLQGFLDPGLRRSAADAALRPTAEQGALYGWLEARAAEPGAVTVGGFPRSQANDAVLRDYVGARAHHEQHVRREALGEVAERLASLEQASTAREQQSLRLAEAAQQQAATLHGELQRLRHELDQARRENAALAGESAKVAPLEQECHRLQTELAQVAAHADAREQALTAMRRSWSWRISAPVRWLADLLGRVLPHRVELGFHRLFYAIPGFDERRKRAGIIWLHRHAPGLTRHTLSYRLYLQEQRLERIEQRATPQRMDSTTAGQWIATQPDPPRISIVMPVHDVDATWLRAAIESVQRQFYPHWELCIADDASGRAETVAVLDDLAARADPRIRLVRLDCNTGIAGASNAALELATGEYVGFLDHDDMLTRDALLEMARRIVLDAPDLLYSDEDKLDADGRHVEPHFKPDFSLDHLFSINYLCHFTVIRRELLTRIGGFRPGYDGAQDFDLVLRASEAGQSIAHIPLVLYHWRKIEGSTAADSAAKPAAANAGCRALADSLARRKLDARAEPGPFPTTYVVRYAIRGTPLVSILIPFRDKPELLRQCVESVLETTAYPHYEIIGLDNGSTDPATLALMQELAHRDGRIRFEHYDAPFNYSAINNFGARQANGEHLLLLNNDTRVIGAEWLGAMLEHSQRPEVGVVGAKLLYEDGTIQHAGVIAGLGGVAGHAHLALHGDDPGHFACAQLIHDVSAVTFACAMTRREVFEQLGGLNELDLTVAFNDIDYCLRAREAGYLVVYTPLATLYHFESKSRGYEDNDSKQARFLAESNYMQRRHDAALQRGDPYYNPNLSLTHPFEPNHNYADALPS
jgi:GT2 family glycosyltransferase